MEEGLATDGQDGTDAGEEFLATDGARMDTDRDEDWEVVSG
jgi:hypothetical protein